LTLLRVTPLLTLPFTAHILQHSFHLYRCRGFTVHLPVLLHTWVAHFHSLVSRAWVCIPPPLPHFAHTLRGSCDTTVAFRTRTTLVHRTPLHGSVTTATAPFTTPYLPVRQLLHCAIVHTVHLYRIVRMHTARVTPPLRRLILRSPATTTLTPGYRLPAAGCCTHVYYYTFYHPCPHGLPATCRTDYPTLPAHCRYLQFTFT